MTIHSPENPRLSSAIMPLTPLTAMYVVVDPVAALFVGFPPESAVVLIIYRVHRGEEVGHEPHVGARLASVARPGEPQRYSESRQEH